MTMTHVVVLLCVGASFAAAGDVRPNGDEHFFVNGLARDVAVGDFDADGRIDIAAMVVENSFTYRLHLMRGDGFGSFAQSTTPLPATPGVVVAGDLDGDGDLDLVIGSGATIPTFTMENDGSGAFTDPGWSTYIGDPTDLEVGDLDLDGDLDIVAAAPAYGLSSNHVRVLIGDGAFGFTALPDLVEPALPKRLALADVNGNGDLDLASVVAIGSTLRVRLGTAGATFAAPVSYATGNSPSDVVAIDVKNDGVVDLVTSATGAAQLAIHFGLGGGAFSAPLLRTTGPGPTALAVGRLDGDDFDDLAVATNTGGYVHRGLATGIEQNGTAQRVLPRTTRVLLANLDGDLFLDAIGVDGGPHVSRVRGDGAGGFLRSLVFGASTGGSASEVDLEYGDFDGDGDFDSFENVSSNVSVRQNLGNGVFATTATLTGFTFPGNPVESIHAPDLNQDGRADLVGRSYAHVGARLGFGNGTFGAQTTYTYATFLQSAVAADFDLDGDIDVAVGEMENIPGQVTIRWNNGGGVLLNPTTFLLGSSSADVFQPSIAALDFNADGKWDIAAADASGLARAKLLRGDGLGGFVQVQTTNLNARCDSLAAGDVDGDGFDDVVGGGGGNHSHDNSGWFLRSNGVQFASATPLDYKAGVSLYATTWVKDAGLADVNGDGFADALFSATSHEAFGWNGHYEIVYFPGQANGSLGAPRSFASASSAHALAALDLDGDARAEIGVLGTGGPASFSILEHGCDGAAGTLGHGCVGSGGFTPRLGFQGCPTPGGNVTLRIDSALGGANALLVVGLAPAALAVSPNCDLLTVPVLPAPIVLPLAGAGAGNGNASIPLVLPANLGSVTFVLQAFVPDLGTTLGAAATQGVIVVVD
jgi:FG-GAP-like repeat